MDKQEFLTYLPEQTSGIFATVRDDGTPDGRGFQFQYEEDGRFYFATANTKDVWKQLCRDFKAAFIYMEPTGKYTLRIIGPVTQITDPEEKQAVFAKIAPGVQHMYGSWDNPVFELIYFDKPELRFAKGFHDAEYVEA